MAQKKNDAQNYGHLPSLDPLWILWIQPSQVTYLSQELEEAQAQRSETLVIGYWVWGDYVDYVDFDSQILFGWFILVQ